MQPMNLNQTFLRFDDMVDAFWDNIERYERMERRVLVVDMDAFYATVEQRDNPVYKGKPIIIVRRDRRTPVMAASYEAKRYGIRNGMPIGEAKMLCPDVVEVSADIGKYLAESMELLKICSSYSDIIEKPDFGLDEFILDVTKRTADYDGARAIGEQLKGDVKSRGLSASIGIAWNKLLAKMASKLMKPDGLTIITTREEAKRMLHSLPVSELYGVGKSTKNVLRSIRIETIGNLAERKLYELCNYFGDAKGVKLYTSARFVDNSDVVPFYVARERKSISHSYTLPFDTDDVGLVEYYMRGVADALENELGYSCWTSITLNVTDENFITSSASMRTTSKNKSEDVMNAAKILLPKVYRGGKIRGLGIQLSGLQDYHGGQLSLVF